MSQNLPQDLALLDPDDNFTVKTVCGYHKHIVKFVDAEMPLREILEEFKKVGRRRKRKPPF